MSVYLKLLGNPFVKSDREEHPLAAERRYQLAAYLACQDRWVPRGELSALFWDAHAGDAARRNLRRLLYDVRQLSWFATLRSSGDCLRWRVPSDLAEFARARSLRDWSRCVRVGKGSLLEGIEHGATEPFHEWLRRERELHLRQWRECISNRRSELRGDPAARLELSLHALKHDAHNEAAIQDLVDNLREAGRETEARQAYREFVRRLKEDLGVEPSLELHGLASAGDAGDLVVAASPDGTAPGSPHLVGRRLEHAEILRLLTGDECRRVTLHGPGGVGKTRLANAVLEQLREAFPAGVHWVALRDLATVEQVPARIAESFGLNLAASLDPLESIAARLDDRGALLVLDNCEHLAGIASVGDKLLARCSRLKILQTSRTRLGCEGERVIPLAGLAVPDADERELEVLRTFDSFRLFESRAREVDPNFDVARDVGHVVALLRIIDGLPLAIEIAAACVRLLSAREIVSDLSRLMDLHRPEDDLTLRATFEHSWRLLSVAEQTGLSRMAVFGGSFSLAAATHVAGIEIAAIASLADKSLVSGAGSGRFALHPLIRQFARRYLRDSAAVRHRHAAYFAAVMAAQQGGSSTGPVSWEDEDMSHCLEAWQWAVSQRALSLLLDMARPLARLFGGYFRWQEGSETFGKALDAFVDTDPQTQRLRAALLYGLAMCRFYSGDLREAEEAARSSLRLCNAFGIHELIGSNLFMLGHCLAWSGEAVKARQFLEHSLRRCRLPEDADSAAKARLGIALLDQAGGDWAAARSRYLENEALCREFHLHHSLAVTLNGLGKVHLAEGAWRDALECFERGIRVCAEHEVRSRSAFLLANKGLAQIQGGDLARAERSIAQALSEARERNIHCARVEAHLSRCALAIAQMDAVMALAHLREAMALAGEARSLLRQLTVIRHWGQWLVEFRSKAHGAAVLEFVRAHAKSQQRDKDIAQATLITRVLGTGPSAAAALEIGALSLASLEAEILGAAA